MWVKLWVSAHVVNALPDSPLLRLVKSMERETFSPIGRVPASEAGPAFSEPGLVGEGETVGAVNSRCGISGLGVSRVDELLPSSRGSGGRGGASSSPIRASRARLFFSSFRLGGGTYKF